MKRQTQELKIPGCGKVIVELQHQNGPQNGHKVSEQNFVQVLGINNNWYPATNVRDIMDLVNKGSVVPS